MATSKPTSWYRLTSAAACCILFSLALLPHYGVADDDDQEVMFTTHQYVSSPVHYSAPLYMVTSYGSREVVASGGNDQFVHFSDYNPPLPNGDVVEFINPNSFDSSDSVHVNDQVVVVLKTYAPPVSSPWWGWFKKDGLNYLLTTTDTEIERANLTITPAPAPLIYPPIYAYFLKSSGSPLVRKTIDGVTYIVQDDGTDDNDGSAIFSFTPYQGPLLAMSTDA